MEQAAHQAFVQVLRNMLHPAAAQPLPGDTDVAEVLKLAMEQNVLPLVFEALSGRPDTQALAEFAAYKRETMMTVMGQMQRTQLFLQLYRAFDAAGLHPLVMKGIVCRALYGQWGDHRPSGDEDILIRPADFARVQAVFMQQGYACALEDVDESKLALVQEVSFVHPMGLHVEVHINPMGHENSLRRQMNGYFTAVFDRAIALVCEGETVHAMSHTDHFLFLVCHALRHFTASGFGLRQVLDILLYAEKYGAEMDWDYLKKTMEEIGALTFCADMMALGNEYLGFDLKEIAPSVCPEEMLRDLLLSGAYGNGTQEQVASGFVTGTAMEMHGATARGTLRKLLPTLEEMERRYPGMGGKWWLYPVCWVRLAVHFVMYRGKKVSEQSDESMQIARRRMDLMKKYDIL